MFQAEKPTICKNKWTIANVKPCFRKNKVPRKLAWPDIVQVYIILDLGGKYRRAMFSLDKPSSKLEMSVLVELQVPSFLVKHRCVSWKYWYFSNNASEGDVYYIDSSLPYHVQEFMCLLSGKERQWTISST